ncbi:MAG: T9SS type A sorting domain-containing protein [Ignavibacteria bacterium]|nr:T9SS type A sorting domain-containing protein [Ignavibacteria bacterium]
MKLNLLCFISSAILFFNVTMFIRAQDSYTVELEQINIPGAPLIHSFAFAQSGDRWLFIGGRTNGLHGFSGASSFPKQYSNINIYVVDPNTQQTWSRNIFLDLPFSVADQFRSANMQYTQIGNKLYFSGGYGYDSTSNGLITFPVLKVIDVSEMINAVMTGTSIAPFVRGVTDSRMQVCGGEIHKLGDYFYLIGGHKFTGTYRILVNDQVYTNQIRKFKINDDGVNVSIVDYTAYSDTAQYHRRDMNVVPAIKPDGITPYMILYGGVFKSNVNLPFLNPVYIDEAGINVDYSFEQKMSQYTCSNMSVYDSVTQKMHTTFFGGTSLYYQNEITNALVYDSLVPFIKDITTLSRSPNGTSAEKVMTLKFPALLGTNANFILSDSIPQFENGVIKLHHLDAHAFAGYIFGGIRALMPNNGLSYPSEYIYRVYINPDNVLPVELASFTSNVNKKNVFLNWSTASESNNSGFEIERVSAVSNNTSAWIKVGAVHGHGNTGSVRNYSFEDKNLTTGKYNYRLKQIDYNGNSEYFYLSGEVVIGVPEKYYLSQNYPNPFNPTTKIDFELPNDGNVTIKIYDNKGSEVKTLTDEFKTAGYYTVNFSGADLASGVYFYKFETGAFVETKKMVVLK